MKPYVPPQHSRSGHPNAIGKRMAQAMQNGRSGSITHPVQWGTVGAVHAGPPKTVDVFLDGSATLTLGLRYRGWYTPTVGDVVSVSRGTGGLSDRIVEGILA